MRVLLTTDTIGGVWTFTAELTVELLQRGHAVALLSIGRAPSPSQACWASTMHQRCGDSFQYEASTAPLEWMNENSFAYQDLLPRLLALAGEFRPDLIHANQFCFGDLPLDCPVLVTAHSDVLSWAEACRPDGLEFTAWLARYCRLVQRGLNGAAAIVAPTQWMLSALDRHFYRACPGRVVHNGRSVPPADAMPRRLQAVTAGRLWDEGKNIRLLTQLDTSLPILVAGDHQYEAASGPSSSGNLQLLGALEEADLLSLFRQSSVYIAPSLYEPFGLAPLEAAQCGCAVVLNDIPSFREVWGDVALYFHDAASLDTLLTHLSQSSCSLATAQHKAGCRARELTAKRMADQYVALYRELLQPAAASRRDLVAHAG